MDTLVCPLRGSTVFFRDLNRMYLWMDVSPFLTDAHNLFLLKNFNICPKMASTMMIRNNGKIDLILNRCKLLTNTRDREKYANMTNPTNDLLMFDFYPIYTWSYNLYLHIPLGPENKSRVYRHTIGAYIRELVCERLAFGGHYVLVSVYQDF